MNQHKKGLAVWIGIVLLLLAGALLAGPGERVETVQETMRDAVLHNVNRISLLGLKEVNPGLISAFLVTIILLIAAALIRIFAVPRFRYIPGRLQLLLEQAVGLFDNMARGSSPHRFRFVGAYIFAAGAFIFVGTLFELLGIQAVTVGGHPITLPAPLSDVNAAIALGTLSYLVILSGGIAANGMKGVGRTLKEFSLPISMSFRLFGALLSGLLVTELVYRRSTPDGPSPSRKTTTSRRSYPMKHLLKKILILAGALVLTLSLAAPAFAADTPAQGEEDAQSQTQEDNTIGLKAIAAGLAVGIAAAGGAVAMGLATAKSTESIARQPEAEGKVRTTLMLGLVFIETAIIYALLVVILIIFVL